MSWIRLVRRLNGQCAIDIRDRIVFATQKLWIDTVGAGIHRVLRVTFVSQLSIKYAWYARVLLVHESTIGNIVATLVWGPVVYHAVAVDRDRQRRPDDRCRVVTS